MAVSDPIPVRRINLKHRSSQEDEGSNPSFGTTITPSPDANHAPEWLSKMAVHEGDMTTTLYRFYDDAGILLYVGVTSVGPSRWSEHERNREWWAKVVRSSVVQYPDRAAALAAEKTAILEEQPLYNTVHRVPRAPRGRIKGKHGTGTVIKRDDGRWAFVARISGKQRWWNVRTEAEALLLQACYTHRDVPLATREKAMAILAGEP